MGPFQVRVHIYIQAVTSRLHGRRNLDYDLTVRDTRVTIRNPAGEAGVVVPRDDVGPFSRVL